MRLIFSTRIVRMARDVRLDDGTVAEVALDRGEITLEATAARLSLSARWRSRSN